MKTVSFLLFALLTFQSAEAVITNSWPFTVPSQYTVSDSQKIEVADGVAKLKLAHTQHANASEAEYQTNNTQLDDFVLGRDVSVGLVTTSGTINAAGKFTSRVIDGGLGNIWQGISVKASNRSLGSHSIWETMATESNIAAIYHFNGAWTDDVSGSNGVPVSSPVFTNTAVFGSQSLYVNGGNSFTTVNGNLLNGATEFTIGFWVQLIDSAQGGGLVCFNKGGVYAGIFYQNGRMYLQHSGDYLQGPSLSLPVNGWLHVVGTYKSGNQLVLYYNGVSVASKSTGIYTVSQTDPIRVGVDPQSALFSRGIYDEVLIYKRALSAAEVQTLFLRGGSLGVRVRSGGALPLTGDFVGPDGTIGTYFVKDSEGLNLTGQYLQYEVSMASDNIQSPYFESARFTGTSGTIIDDVRGDLGQGSNAQGASIIPVQLGTPYVTLAKGLQGVATNGTFTSRVLDGGAGVSWGQVKWTRGSELPSAIYGLEGLWHLNQDLGDASGKGHYGALTGGFLYTLYAKAGDYSAVFNGSDAAIGLGNFQSTLRSFEFWMNSDLPYSGVLECDPASAWLALSNRMLVVNGWMGGAPAIYVNSKQSPQLMPGWNHVAVVFPSTVQATNLTVGLARGSYFAGRMDDIAVYSRALTRAEVAQHYETSRREVAGRIRLQVRADTNNPPKSFYVGPDGTPATYFLDPNGTLLSATLNGKQYLQYRAQLEGDGTAGPLLSAVTLTYGSGQSTGDFTSADFSAGSFDGGTTRLHGDEMTLRPLSSAGPISLNVNSSLGLLGLWHMDDLSWAIGSATVVDSSGSGLNGTPYGTAAVADSAAVGPRYGSFSSNGYVAVSGISLGSLDFSVSAWFKTTSGSRAALVSTYNGSTQPYIALEINGDGSLTKTGIATFVVSDGVASAAATAKRSGLNDGNWHHLSCVRNGRQVHIYVDGLLSGTSPLGAGFGSVGSAQFMIAKYGSQSIFFSGGIDEVAVHQRALAEGEIGEIAALGYRTGLQGQFIGPVVDAGQIAYWETLYWGADAPYGRPIKRDPGVVGLWHCDSISNNYTMDSSGYGNDGLASGGASTNQYGRFDGGISLSGAGLLTVSDNPSLRLNTFSIEAWINPTNMTSITVAQKTTGGTGFQLGVNATGQPFLTVNGVTTTDSDVLRGRKWNHVCGTHDGQTARLYVNGLLKGTVIVGGSSLNSASLMLGSGLAGFLDEAALYSRVLNGEEILDHYRAGIGALKFQVRSFSGSPQGTFVGPDGTTNTFFVDPDGSSLLSAVSINQYFQYKAIASSEDARFAPCLDSVRIDASAYPVDNPWIAPADGYGSSFYGHLVSFSHSATLTNTTAIQYQISGNNGTNWYAWVGGQWEDVSAYTNYASQWTMSNPRDVIDSNIGSFYDSFLQGVGGVFKFRAFLKSDAITQVMLDQVDLGYAKGRIVLTSPNGTEVSNNAWVVNVPYNITWTTAGSVTSTNIIIELYNQSGSSFVKTLAAGVTNSGIYRTVIHTEPGANYRIRIRDGSDPVIYDWSDNDFELVYNLHLSIPNGGEKWYVGETNGVSWESPLATEMALWLSNDDGNNNWVEVARAPTVTGTNGYAWIVQTQEAMLPSLVARMAVSTPDVQTPFQAPFYDLSDHSFIMAGLVITYPNASSGVKMGDTVDLEWTSAAAGPAVSIELYDGTVWTNIGTSVANVDGTNSFTCTLNAPNPTEQALIRIKSLSDSRIINVSEPFLLADIRILSPKGGTPTSRDKWQIGTTNVISWVSGGAGSFVNVDYSTNGVIWKSIVANYPNTNSTSGTVITNFAPLWVVPGPPSSNALIRVSSVERPDLKAITDPFDMAGVQVLAPNGGEYWEFIGTNAVQWLHQGAGFNLGISITYNGGATTNDYITLDPSLSIFSGLRTVLPGRLLRPSTLAKVRLVANDTVGSPIPMTDISDAYFTIRGLSVFLPTSNSVYTMGTTVIDGLQWYSAATEDPTADLYYSKDGSNYTSLIVANAANVDAGSSWNHRDWDVSRSLLPSKTARVKVIAGSYQAVSPVFTLRGIRITQPSAGQLFDLGARQFVYWTAAGLQDTAYASNVVSIAGQGGSYVSGALPNNVYIRNGALTWNIDPDLDPSTNAVIKMIVTTPTNDTDIIMYSDPFTLRGAKITSPSTGTTWAVGSSQSIVFKAAGMADGAVANLYYSADGTTYDIAHPVAINVPMLSGINTVPWNIENSSALTRQPSTNAVLMLVSGTVTNYSKPFRMSGIKVTAPKGTDIWAVSDGTNVIQWVGVDAPGPFNLSYTVYDDPMHSAVIASGAPGYAYNWAMVSNSIGTNVSITISGNGYTNESPRFQIVPAPSVKIISPASGEYWKVGETNNMIRWVRGGNMSNDFTLGYSPYPYTVTNTLATGPFVETEGIYEFIWGPIPNSLGPVRIVVVNNVNANIADVVDNFRIAPTFQISPFIGEIFALEAKDVNWTTLGSVSGVDFYYSTDPFRATNSWTLINTSGPFLNVGHNQSSSYIWTVPNLRTSSAWLRIQDHAYAGTMFDASKKGPYDDLGTFEIKYYTVVWRVFDAATSNEMTSLSVADSSSWTASGLDSPVTHEYPFGNWNTIWFKQYFNDKIVLNWSSKLNRTNMVYMSRTEAEPQVHVMANFVFDPSNSVFKTVAWLERNSQIIPDPSECTIYVYDPEGNQADKITVNTLRPNGTFWADISTVMDKNRPYFAKVEIKYSGALYTSGITFTLLTPADSAVAAVNAARDAVLASVSNVNNNVTSVGVAVGSLRTDVTNRLTSLSNTTAQIRLDTSDIRTNLSLFSSNALAQLNALTNAIGVIGPSGTNLIDQVKALTQEVDKRTARILTRPDAVKLGSSFNVFYRSMAGSGSTLTVTDSNGVVRASFAMTELSGGVFEKLLTASWGLGDFTVACSDGTGASDRMIVRVTASDIDDLAGSMVSVSNQLARVEITLTNLSGSVSNIDRNVYSMTTNLTGLITDVDFISMTVSNMPGQMAFLTNAVGQIITLTNITPAVAAMTSAVAQITALTNMNSQLSFVTNMVGQLGVLTNLSSQMSSVTNSVAKLGLMTNTMNSLASQMNYVTNVIDQIVVLTNINPAVAAMTNAVGQISGLTNMGSQLNFLTNAMSSVQGLTNLPGQVASLTNLPVQVASVSNMVAKLGPLTNLTSQVNSLTNNMAALMTLTNTPGQLGILTNAVAQLGGLTNLGPQMSYLTNVIDQIVILTNINPAVAAMTNAVGQLGALTNMGDQLNFLTNAMGSVQGLTNLSAQMASLTNMPAQVASLTGMVARLGPLTNLTSQVGSLTNNMALLMTLTNAPGQLGYLTNAVAQLGGLTNLGSQMAYLTNVIDQIVVLTNINPAVAAMTGAVAQITVMTNLGSQVAYLTNAMWSLNGITNLVPQVSLLTNLTTRMAGLTNLTPQVGYLTNSMAMLMGLTNAPNQLNSLTNMVTQLSGLTNINAQVASMTNAIGQIAAMTNMPGQMNYLTNIISQLSGMTNISDQVASMTNAIGQISAMTNLPSQMNYMTNIVSQLSGITNIGSQVASMTNAIGQIAGMTNLPSQMNYMTNIVSQLTGITNIGDQVASMTNAIGQISGLTNFSSQMNYMTNIMSQLTGITNIGDQVASMTNSIGLIAGLTNLSGQLNFLTNSVAQLGDLTNLTSQMTGLTNLPDQVAYLTNLVSEMSLATSGLTNMPEQINGMTNIIAQLAGITNIGDQVASMTNAIGQISAMTNLPSQMNYLTNMIDQLSGMTNIGPQVASMTNAIGQISAMTNMPSQMNYLTNVIDQLSGMTNIGPQVASMTNAIGQISAMTNLPSQMNYLTNVIDQLSGMTNIGPQVASMTNAIGQISAMTNLPSQMNYLTNVINQLSGMTNIGPQVASMTNAIGQISGLTNMTGQLNYLTNGVSQLGGLTNLSWQMAGLTNLTGQMNYLTNVIDQLTGMTNIGSQVASMTNAIGQIAGMTNLPSQMTFLTNALSQFGALTNLTGQVASLTNLSTQVSGLTNLTSQIAGLTNMPSQLNALTNVIGQLTGLTNMSDQVAVMTNAIGQIAAMTNLQAQVNYLTNVPNQVSSLTNVTVQLTGISNLYNSIETRLGSVTDGASASTVFGQLAALEQDVASAGVAATQAGSKASGARSQANAAAGASQRIKQEVASGQMTKVMGDLDIIRKSLESTLSQVKGIPGEMSTAEMAKTISEAAATIRKMAADRGLSTSGGPTQAQVGSLTDPKAVGDLLNQLAETKAMMEATRLLMDNAINKPVVVDWLEGSK